MGYADFLRQMLKPMGVYRLNDGYSAAEIEAVGDALDKVSAKLGAFLSGSTYAESGGDYLKMLESLFPIVNFAETEEERRQNILTLMSVNDNFSDKAALEAVLKACGLEAEIVVLDDKFTVELHFTNIRGELSEEELAVCKAIMPAHVILRCFCEGLTWDRAEELFPTWNDFDNAGLTAYELAKLK